MQTITKIEVQKKNKERYSIYLNDQYAFGVQEATLIKFALFKGSQLSPEQIKEIEHEDYLQRAYSLSLRYLTHQMRTEKEVRQKLVKNEISPAAIEATIQRLKEQKYIDDQFYADSFTRTSANLSRKGPKLVERELKNKGVLQSEIQQALEEYSPQEQIANGQEIAQKYLNRLANVSPREAKQKVIQFLMQKGYAKEIYEQIIPNLSFEKQEEMELDILAKHAEKMFTNYGRKATGKQLIQKVKSALYRKGFVQEDIDSYMRQKEMELEE